MTVTVLLPNGTKDEANAARDALAQTGWKLVMGTAWGHTSGQALNGDVVLVGSGPASLETDVTGRLYKVESIEKLAELGSKPRKAADPVPEGPASESGTARRDLDASVREEDDFTAMSRVQLIQLAAKRWPKAEQWVKYDTDALRDRVRELSH